MFLNLKTSEPNPDFFYERFWRDVQSAQDLLCLQIDVSYSQHDGDPDRFEQMLIDLDACIDPIMRRLSAYQPVTAPELLALFMCVCARTAATSEPDDTLAKILTAGARNWVDAAEPDDPRVEALVGLLDLVAINAQPDKEPQPAPARRP